MATHKINKQKRTDKQSQEDRLKERLNNLKYPKMYSLTDEIDFGKYKDSGYRISGIIKKDSAYIQWALENKFMRLDKEAFDFFAQILREETQAEFDRIRKENAERDRRERERREREKAEENQRWQRQRERVNDAFESLFGRQQKVEVVEKIVSPACQWDHLPDKQKFGSILRLQEVMVSGTVSKEAIKKQWIKLLMEYHPDKVSDRGELIKSIAHEMTIRINEAYEYFKKAYGI